MERKKARLKGFRHATPLYDLARNSTRRENHAAARTVGVWRWGRGNGNYAPPQPPGAEAPGHPPAGPARCPPYRYQHDLSGTRTAYPLCHRADGRSGALSSGRRPRNGARSKPQPQPRLCERGHRLVGRRPGPGRPRPLDISALLERPPFLVPGFARPGGSLGLSRRVPDGGRADL